MKYLMLVIIAIINACNMGEKETKALDVKIPFRLYSGQSEVDCTSNLMSLSQDSIDFQLQDIRLFISRLHLKNESGDWIDVALAENDFQNQNVALLDFENLAGFCSEGNQDLNTQIVGTIPAGKYSGIKFEVGVPEDINHDEAKAKGPMSLVKMQWNWTMGYKFLKWELLNDTTSWSLHLGSIGCKVSPKKSNPLRLDRSMEAIAHGGVSSSVNCLNSNRLLIEFSNFDINSQELILDLKAALTGVSLDLEKPGAYCLSRPEDPNCKQLLQNFGLSVEDGGCGDFCQQQKFIRAE